MIANVNAYGCTMAGMWLTQLAARLPNASFLQMHVVLEVQLIKMLI